MPINIKNLIFFSLIVLVTSIPFLEFIAFNLQNSNEQTDLRVDLLTIKRLSSLYLIFIVFLSLLIFFLKKKFKNNIFDIIIYLSFLYWFFFKYNELKKIFNTSFLSFLSDYDGILSLFLLIVIITLFSILFFKKKSNFINILITFFFIINFIYFSSIIIFKKDFSIKYNQQNFEFENIIVESPIRQNIYLFILDAMPPIEIADKILKTNSNNFLNKLSSKGFTYIEDSQTISGNTFFTIGSIFNLKPLEKIDEKLGYYRDNLKYPQLTYPTLLRKDNLSNLEYNLIRLGYDFKWIGSHFANCYGYNSAYCIKKIGSSNVLINYENLSFLKKSPFLPLMRYFLNIFNITIEEKIIFKSNNAIESLNKYLKQNGKPTKPTFILIHHLVSHWPYLVDSNCDYEKNAGKLNKIGIKKAFECNKKLISNISDTLIDYDKDAIVLIQSDHNWELSYHKPSIYGDRNKIFNLIKTNSFCKEYHNLARQNTNAIRLALYCATNTKPKFD